VANASLARFSTPLGVASKLNVLGEDGDTLGVDGAEVGVFKQVDQIRFTRLLKSHESVRLEAQIHLEVLRDLAHETLEGQFAKEKLRRLLVAVNLAKCHRTRTIAMRLLDAFTRDTMLTNGLGAK